MTHFSAATYNNNFWRGFTLEGCNDEHKWDMLLDTQQSFDMKMQSNLKYVLYPINNSKIYTQYRFTMYKTAKSGKNYAHLCLVALEMFGRLIISSHFTHRSSSPLFAVKVYQIILFLSI